MKALYDDAFQLIELLLKNEQEIVKAEKFKEISGKNLNKIKKALKT